MPQGRTAVHPWGLPGTPPFLALVFGRAIPDLQPSFDEFAAALKHRAESSF